MLEVKLLQVKSANFTSQFAHNANSGTGFVSTNITLDITPTSASSKIYVRADFNIWKSGASAQVNMTLYRDSTNFRWFILWIWRICYQCCLRYSMEYGI